MYDDFFSKGGKQVKPLPPIQPRGECLFYDTAEPSLDCSTETLTAAIILTCN